MQALRGEPLTIYGDGSQTRSFCYVDDLIEGILRLSRSDEHLPVNIGNPDEFTILECAQAVLEVTGSKSKLSFESLPQDDPTRRSPDITKARALLGWEPRIPLAKAYEIARVLFKPLGFRMVSCRLHRIHEATFFLNSCWIVTSKSRVFCYSCPIMKRALFLFITAVFFLSIGLPAAAQKFLPKSIQFKGDPEYSDQELIAAAGLKNGVVLDSDEMNEHSKRLMDSGVFDTLKFTFDGQDLIFTLTPSTSLFPIRLENLPLTPGKELDAKLHDRFPLYHGKVPSAGTLLESVRGALEEMLATQGIKATVKAMPFGTAGTKNVSAMNFTIESPPVRVGTIQLDGISPAMQPGIKSVAKKKLERHSIPRIPKRTWNIPSSRSTPTKAMPR